MAFYSFRVGPYSRSIYLDGAKTFADITTDYWAPVKQYAATNFTYAQIDNAYGSGYISLADYNETVALKELIEPRPVLLTKAAEPLV